MPRQGVSFPQAHRRRATLERTVSFFLTQGLSHSLLKSAIDYTFKTLELFSWAYLGPGPCMQEDIQSDQLLQHYAEYQINQTAFADTTYTR